MEPLVSVVMATYNGEKYLASQLESILHQDYRNLEIIIVDDCSSDRSVAIARAYAARDPRILLLELPENRGAVKAFEAGLSRTVGAYIALSDQDDLFEPNKVSTMVAAFQAHPEADLALSDLRLISEEGRVITDSMWSFQKVQQKGGRPFGQLAYTNFVTGCACMFTRRLLSAALPFPEDCIIHDWWLSVLAASGRCGGILLIPLPLVSYRQHAVNVIGAHSGGVTDALRRAPDLKQRTLWYQKNVDRIRGYLRHNIWSEAELRELRAVEKVFQSFLSDGESGLPKRLRALPGRWSYAATQNATHLLGIVLFTLFPRIVEWLRALLPEAGIGSARKGK